MRDDVVEEQRVSADEALAQRQQLAEERGEVVSVDDDDDGDGAAAAADGARRVRRRFAHGGDDVDGAQAPSSAAVDAYRRMLDSVLADPTGAGRAAFRDVLGELGATPEEATRLTRA